MVVFVKRNEWDESIDLFNRDNVILYNWLSKCTDQTCSYIDENGIPIDNYYLCDLWCIRDSRGCFCDPSKIISVGQSSVHIALQILDYMGCREIHIASQQPYPELQRGSDSSIAVSNNELIFSSEIISLATECSSVYVLTGGRSNDNDGKDAPSPNFYRSLIPPPLAVNHARHPAVTIFSIPKGTDNYANKWFACV